MKISELIKYLQDYLDKKGDGNAMIRYSNNDWLIGSTDLQFREVDGLIIAGEMGKTMVRSEEHYCHCSRCVVARGSK